MKDLKQYLVSLPVMALAVSGSLLIEPYVDEGSVMLVYMLAVVVSSFFLEMGPALLVTVIGVFVFDYFNLPPFMTFTRTPLEYVFSWGVMAATAATISTLAGRLRQQAQDSEDREARTGALYRLSSELAGCQGGAQVMEIARRHLGLAFRAIVDVGPLESLLQAERQWPFPQDTLQRLVHDGGIAVSAESGMLCAGGRIRIPGQEPVLVLLAAGARHLTTAEQEAHLHAMLNLIELTLDRLALRERVQTTELRVRQEGLRNSILNALSHDLRTPLASIIGASSSMMEQGEALTDLDRGRLRRVVHEEALHMQGMVENLLDLARLQGESLNLSREWQAVEEIVGCAVTAVRRRMSSHRLETLVPDDLPLLRCDSVLIERVLINLIENAYKYSPPGGAVRIRAMALGGVVRLAVEDDGAGIPEALRATIFDPFVRHAPVSSGVGLGLAICKRIVEAHRGRIWTETTSGGAAFLIELPLPDEAAPTALEVAAGGWA